MSSGSGTDVADAISSYLPRNIPILVHSTNVSRGPMVAERLGGAGFDVLRLSFTQLLQRSDVFQEWQSDALEEWEDGEQE